MNKCEEDELPDYTINFINARLHFEDEKLVKIPISSPINFTGFYFKSDERSLAIEIEEIKIVIPNQHLADFWLFFFEGTQ